MRPARLALLVLATAVLSASSARAQPSPDRPVGQWIGVALDEIALTGSTRRTPRASSRR